MNASDDHLVWSLTEGSTLTCRRSMVMQDGGEVAFSAGQAYRVSSMHPIADPPFVRVLDNQGHSHILTAEHLRGYFGS